MTRYKYFLAVLLLMGTSWQLTATEIPIQLFAERDGLIVMEAEQAQEMKGYTVGEDTNAAGGKYD